MPVSTQEMDKMLEEFLKQQNQKDKDTENKDTENVEKEVHKKKKQKKSPAINYQDPQKDNQRVEYNQNESHLSQIQLQQDQLIYSSQEVAKGAGRGLISFFSLLRSIRWSWVIGAIVVILVIANISSIIQIAIILFIAFILLYGFLGG